MKVLGVKGTPGLENWLMRVMGDPAAGGFGMTDVLQAYTWYSIKALAAAAIASVTTFFGDALGQNATTEQDTNMVVGGQISKDEAFLCTSINLLTEEAVGTSLLTTAIFDNIYRTLTLIRGNCTVKLNVNGGNEILTVPCSQVPQGVGLAGSASGSASTAQLAVANYTAGMISNGLQMATNAYPFLYPMNPGLTFNAQLLRSGASVTTLQAMRWGIALNGIRFRRGKR